MILVDEPQLPPEAVHIPPILGCVFGLPILVVALWFLFGFYRAPRPDLYVGEE